MSGYHIEVECDWSRFVCTQSWTSCENWFRTRNLLLSSKYNGLAGETECERPLLLQAELEKVRELLQHTQEQEDRQATAQWEVDDARRRVEELEDEIEQQKEQTQDLKVQVSTLLRRNTVASCVLSTVWLWLDVSHRRSLFDLQPLGNGLRGY